MGIFFGNLLLTIGGLIAYLSGASITFIIYEGSQHLDHGLDYFAEIFLSVPFMIGSLICWSGWMMRSKYLAKKGIPNDIQIGQKQTTDNFFSALGFTIASFGVIVSLIIFFIFALNYPKVSQSLILWAGIYGLVPFVGGIIMRNNGRRNL